MGPLGSRAQGGPRGPEGRQLSSLSDSGENRRHRLRARSRAGPCSPNRRRRSELGKEQTYRSPSPKPLGWAGQGRGSQGSGGTVRLRKEGPGPAREGLTWLALSTGAMAAHPAERSPRAAHGTDERRVAAGSEGHGEVSAQVGVTPTQHLSAGSEPGGPWGKSQEPA